MGTRRAVLAWSLAAALIHPAQAQSTLDDPAFPIEPQTAQTPSEGLRDVGRTAESAAGTVGERQSARDIAPEVNALDRIDSRVRNRVQNRVRNRIDRYYDPTANATSPFEVANAQTRKGTRPR